MNAGILESEAAGLGRRCDCVVAPTISVHGPWARMGQLKNEKEEQALVPLDGTRVLPG